MRLFLLLKTSMGSVWVGRRGSQSMNPSTFDGSIDGVKDLWTIRGKLRTDDDFFFILFVYFLNVI